MLFSMEPLLLDLPDSTLVSILIVLWPVYLALFGVWLLSFYEKRQGQEYTNPARLMWEGLKRGMRR